MSAVIEFLGLSRSGKTTQINLLVRALKAAGYSATVIGRPSKKYESNQGLEEWHKFVFGFLCEARQAYLVNPTDYLIYDRGFYDRLALLAADYADRYVSKNLHDSLLRAGIRRAMHVDVVLLFTVSPDLSLARWTSQRANCLDRSSLGHGLDTRDSLQGLTFLMEVYQALKAKHGDPKWYEIDGAVPIEQTHHRIISILSRKSCGISSQ